MAVKNSLVQPKETLSAYLTKEAVKKQIGNIVGGKNSTRFITSIVAATNQTPSLQKCTHQSILAAALQGEALGLSPSPVVGEMYLVPYGEACQFQIGYLGYITLALRTNQYKDIDVFSIKEGEFLGRDSETGKYKFSFITDEAERESKPTIGFLAYYELLNGFRRTLYWSVEKMKNHAQEYSNGYRADLAKGTKYTFWSKNFEAMAYKTMLRQLLKIAPKSIDLVTAIESDMAAIKDDGTYDYIDNTDEVIDITPDGTEDPKS